MWVIICFSGTLNAASCFDEKKKLINNVTILIKMINYVFLKFQNEDPFGESCVRWLQ